MKQNQNYSHMKRFIFSIFIIAFVTTTVVAQESFKKEVTWLGLDFTEAKLFPKAAFANPEAIRTKYLLKWNQIVLNESKKFNVSKFFKIGTLHYDISIVGKRNLAISLENLIVDDNKQSFSEENVKNIIIQYKKTEGIGLVFIVESFNKTNTTGTFWATFYDRSTHEILSTKRIQGLATGMGIRNYWANSIYRAMKSYKRY